MASEVNETRATGSRLRGLGRNLLLLTATLALCCAAGEMAFRLVMKDSIVLFPRYHTAAHYGDFTIRSLRPNARFMHTSADGRWEFVTNAQGFRNNRDFSEDKPAGVLRVVALGDSHTQGFEVRQDQTFSAVIERELKSAGIPAEVYNMGISGYSTAEALVLLREQAIRYKPDVVVLGFFANDFEDNIKAGLFALRDHELVVEKHSHIPGVRILDMHNRIAALRWLSENSYLYSFFLNSVWTVAKDMLLSKAEAQLQTEYAISTEEVTDYKLALTERLLEEIHETCRRNGARFIVIDIPRILKSGAVVSSVPPEFRDAMARVTDAFVDSSEIGLGRDDDTLFHVPHGHRHISPLSHQRLGAAVARLIREMRQ